MTDSIESFLEMKSAPSPGELALFERAKKYMRCVAWIPGLRMVAVCNSLSMYASDPDSDIDLFVVTDPRRMWLSRVMMTVVFQLLGVRRHSKHVAGRFCLSFFATTDSLDFQKIAIENDVYLQAWIAHLKPIVDRGGTYAEFLAANRDFVPVSETERRENRRFLAIKQEERLERFPWLSDMLDRFFRFLFLPRTLARYESLGKPEGVIVSESLLKFHPKDRRREIAERFLPRKKK